jgi:RNA polymerase sigma factor (sigma-70 family)
MPVASWRALLDADLPLAPICTEIFLNHRRGSWAGRCARHDVTHPSPESLLVESRWLTGLTLALCGDGNRAADLFQATWLVAMTHPPGDDTRLRPWLRRVASRLWWRTCRGDQRRRRRELDAQEVGPPRDEAAPSDAVERAELHHAVLSAVMALGEPYRTTVLLRFVDDESEAAIAARLGVPIATVRTRLRRALDQLRDKLDSRWGARPAWVALALARTGMRTGASVAACHASPLILGALTVAIKTKVAAVVALLMVGAGAGTWLVCSDLSTRPAIPLAPVVRAVEAPVVGVPPASELDVPARQPVTNESPAPIDQAPSADRSGSEARHTERHPSARRDRGPCARCHRPTRRWGHRRARSACRVPVHERGVVSHGRARSHARARGRPQ